MAGVMLLISSGWPLVLFLLHIILITIYHSKLEEKAKE